MAVPSGEGAPPGAGNGRNGTDERYGIHTIGGVTHPNRLALTAAPTMGMLATRGNGVATRKTVDALE